MRKNKLLLLLVLLMTAATGAWAQGAKHSITATYSEQTRLLEQPLPYETTVGALYEAVTGESFSDLLSRMTAFEKPLKGISSNNTDVVSIGEFNGASTPVTVNADGKATVILNFSGFAQGIYVSVVPPPLYVTMADGTKDAANWTATVGTNSNAKTLPVGELSEGNAVTLKYKGRLKVKNVTATTDAKPVWDGDLSKLTAESTAEFATATDGTTLTGTLAANVKVSIAAGATVTLDGVTINGANNDSYSWAGLNCLGDATIVLKDGTTNTVKGFCSTYPGIHVPEGSTLIITGGTEGNGKLTASSNGYGAGIGGGSEGGSDGSCGNITITGGDITATGGVYCAGIGGGNWQPCGNITISGGTVTATGGPNGAGIGGGSEGSCGNITITNDVTSVTATKGMDAFYSIGLGYNGGKATCGTVTIGGTKYWENNAAVNDGATYLAQATIVYPNPLATPLTIEAISAGTIQVNIDGTLSTGMKYSVNGGTKTNITSTTTIEGLKAGDKVQFYSNGTGNTAYSNDPEVNISGGTAEVKVYGNIMSLLDEEGFATNTKLQNYAFLGLFLKNTTLIDASELLLPAATLAVSCYQQMFQGCTALTKAPKLPATTLKSYCYYGMFQFCTSLTAAPELPATWLGMGCYAQMFSGCTSLTTAYVKAAYKNESDECAGMFGGCTATGATLHTTSGNKASWEGVMGTGKEWENWTVAADWQE